LYQYWKSWTEDRRKVVTPISGSQAATSPPQRAATSGRSRRAMRLAARETAVMHTIPSRAQARAQASFLGSMIVMS